MERFVVPLDPSVRHQWKVGDRFQVMKTVDSWIDYEVVEIRETEMVVSAPTPKPEPERTRSKWRPSFRPASHRRRRSSLAEP